MTDTNDIADDVDTRLYDTAFNMPQIDSHVLKPLLDMRLKACDRTLDLIDGLAALGKKQRTAILVFRGQVMLELDTTEHAMVGQQGLADWEFNNFMLRLAHLRNRLSQSDEVTP